MPKDQAIEQKIKVYLDSLGPKAIAALVRNLEKGGAANGNDLGLSLVLSAAQEILRSKEGVIEDIAPAVPRRANIQRMFFSPLNDFLIAEHLPNRQEARINRDVLQKVWTWLARDILPGDCKLVTAQATDPKVSSERVEALVQALRRRSVDAIGQALSQAEESEKHHRRIGIELGGERGIEELADIHKILAAEHSLMPFLHSLPESINEARLKNDHDILKLVGSYTSNNPDQIPLVAAAMVDRADAPSALCAFAGRLAGNSNPRAIATSQFSPFVDVVMSEAERLQILAREHRDRNPDPVGFSQALSDYHTLVRGLEMDMDLTTVAGWKRRLSDSKRAISEIVSRELNAAHGAVRRALQVPKADAEGKFALDQYAVDDAVRALRVVVMVRDARDSLAVNDVAKRTRQTVEQTLEILTRALIGDLGKAKAQTRDAHLAAADTAIMLSEIFYGSEYAGQLKRSRQAAIAKSIELEKEEADTAQQGLAAGKLLKKA